MKKQYVEAAKRRAKSRSKGLVSIWALIIGLVVGSLILTVLGTMDWTPSQANVPAQAEPVRAEDLLKAVDEGGLRLGN
jgi:ABC-type uncharacterized transport system permease subunit